MGGGTSPGVSYILHFILYQSSIISHQSSIINHQSSMINDQSIVSTHQSSIFARHAVITFDMYPKIKKKDRKKLSPEAREKKDSSAKSLNDIKKSKRKSAKNYPQRHEKKRIAPQSL